MLYPAKVDWLFYEQVLVVLYRRVQGLRRVPRAELCHELMAMGDQYAHDGDKPFPGCLPEFAPFGGLWYPHEEFLRKYNLLNLATWRNLMRRFRNIEVNDPEVIAFTDELCVRLNIAA
ncbi:MAG: hypothetical protein HZC01_02800 [Candidatus Kerfeldbacteria bacterium]|nr:hypothetical protein [Candidatus Kerfeldbacteria bacterium]